MSLATERTDKRSPTFQAANSPEELRRLGEKVMLWLLAGTMSMLIVGLLSDLVRGLMR